MNARVSRDESSSDEAGTVPLNIGLNHAPKKLLRPAIQVRTLSGALPFSPLP